MLRRSVLFCSLVLGSMTCFAQAEDLFRVNVTGSTDTVKAGSNSAYNLINDVAQNKNQFSVFGDQSFTANIKYAGIKNAIKITQSFDAENNRIVNLKVPSVGLDHTFNSASGDLDHQIRDFIKSEGLAELGAFQRIVDRTSIAGVVDGNPMAATALLTDYGFSQFGFQTHPTGGSGDEEAGGHGDSYYSVNGGVIRTGGFNGTYVDLDLASEIHFSDVIGLAFNGPFRWLSIDGADVYMGGLIVGLPINVINSEGGNGVSWQITPAGHAGAVGSADFVSGGIIYGGQIDSSFNISFNGLTFTIADQAAYYHGASIDIAGYHFDTPTDQWLFKNGAKVSQRFGAFFIDAGASWTNFLRDAFTDGYLSPEAGLGFAWGKDHSSGIRVAYEGNFGNHYNSNGGNIELFIRN